MTDQPSEPSLNAAAEPRWPNVLGLLAVLVGTVGVVAYGCCGGGSLFLQPFLQPASDEPLTAVERELLRVQQAVNQRFFLWMLFNALASAALSIFLMIGGLALRRQESWAPSALMTWAGIRLIHAPIVALMLWLQGRAHWQARLEALERMDQPVTDPGVIMMFWLWAVPVLVVIWGWILPVFFLIWFRLPRVRAEIGTWRGGRPLRY